MKPNHKENLIGSARVQRANVNLISTLRILVRQRKETQCVA